MLTPIASPKPSNWRTRPANPSSSWSATSITASTGEQDRAGQNVEARESRDQTRGAPTMMHTSDVLKVFAEHRGDAIVISGRGGRHWIRISDTALDIPLGDPAMGGHSGFGLGVALAQPNKRVVLFDSEGDILMSLGQLPTIAEQAPAYFYQFILYNEVYATTGGQPVPGAKNVDYAAMARACGYPRAFGF